MENGKNIEYIVIKRKAIFISQIVKEEKKYAGDSQDREHGDPHL